jgi:glyoxylase-like metal-dependent hydrolase (beta-lactamase superfamily II)
MADVVHHTIGAVRLHRVPYFDIPIDGAGLGLAAEHVRAVDWGEPVWATPEGHLRVGQAVWVIEASGAVIVVDPCCAADEFLRSGAAAIEHQDAVLGALAAADFPSDEVTTVFLSHVDGIGMAAVTGADGSWRPAFPRARVVMSSAELDHVAVTPELAGVPALTALIAAGVVDAVADGTALAPEVSVIVTGGHTPGHAVLRISSEGSRAVVLGHLAVNPLHVTLERCPSLHLDSHVAATALSELLTEAADDEALVIGPLWPGPGAGHVSGPPWRVQPAA